MALVRGYKRCNRVRRGELIDLRREWSELNPLNHVRTSCSMTNTALGNEQIPLHDRGSVTEIMVCVAKG